MPIRSFIFLTIFPLVLLLVGCTTLPTSSRPAHVAIEPYRMARLDEAHISTKDGGTLILPVTQEGTMEIAGMNHNVLGMPTTEIQTLLWKQYPNAREIRIQEFRPNRVTVLGEVFHQIHTELTDGPMRVMDAIAAANGFTPLANKRRVKLLRQNAGEVEVYELDLRTMMRGGNLEQNLLLKPGDVVTVPRNFL